MSTRRLATIAALFVLGVFCVPDSATAQEVGVEYRVAGQHAYDPSFDAFGVGDTPNVFAAPTLAVVLGLDEWLPIEGLGAYGELTRSGTGSDRFSGAYDFHWRRNTYLLGAEYARELTPHVTPFGRAAVGLSRQIVSVRPNGDFEYSQSRLGFASRLSAGIELRTPFAEPGDGAPALALGKKYSFGASLQSGYLFQTSHRFDALRPPDGAHGDEEGDWRRSGYSLGRLRSGGWFWAVGLVFRARL